MLIRSPETYHYLTLKGEELFSVGPYAFAVKAESDERLEVGESAYGGVPIGSRL